MFKKWYCDREFWIEKRIGAKFCSYFVKFLGSNLDRERVEALTQELDGIVNQLISMGVPEAQRLHNALTAETG